jgi:hypothetical protein
VPPDAARLRLSNALVHFLRKAQPFKRSIMAQGRAQGPLPPRGGFFSSLGTALLLAEQFTAKTFQSIFRLNNEKILPAQQTIAKLNAPPPAEPAAPITPSAAQPAAVAHEVQVVRYPRVVVMGDERSGKSSTIERITQVDLFTRSHLENVPCTRMPTLLRLRNKRQTVACMAESSPHSPKVTLTIPKCFKKDKTTVYNAAIACEACSLTIEEVRDRVAQQMAAIRKESGKGVESDAEITIDLESPSLIEMDLLDLPGLRQLNPHGAAEDDLPALLEQCNLK